jgi:N-acetylglucosamine kinase-like BadF-type ATPase
LYLGIDAGQTHTEAVLVNEEGETLARGVGGSSHIQGAVMDEVFRESLLSALESMDAGAITAKIASVGLGVTGLSIPGKRQAVLSSLKQLFPNASVFMDNDAVVHHWGAAGFKDGSSILAGTGTIAYGEYNGRSCRLGGFGYLFGDEGGGFWIGLTAVRQAIRAAEGRAPATNLANVIENYFGVESVRKVPGMLYSRSSVDVKRIAELAPLVCREAANDDEVAKAIVVSAGDELANLTIQLLRNLDVPPDEAYPVYRLGGIWRSGDLLNRSFMEKVNALYPNVVWAVPQYNPAAGAALMARMKHLASSPSSGNKDGEKRA